MSIFDEIRADVKAGTLPTEYDGYDVDENGNVWSRQNWRGYGIRKLTPHLNSHGYPAVKVKTSSGMKKMMVHVAVCTAFHGPKPSKYHQVRHLNGVRDDNRAKNLAWGTPAENAADRSLHGNFKVNWPGLEAGHNRSTELGNLRRKRQRSAFCLHPECERPLHLHNIHGLCQKHKHFVGICECPQCAGRKK